MYQGEFQFRGWYDEKRRTFSAVCTLLVSMESNLHFVMELAQEGTILDLIIHARSKKRNNFLRIEKGGLIIYTLWPVAPPNANKFRNV